MRVSKSLICVLISALLTVMICASCDNHSGNSAIDHSASPDTWTTDADTDNTANTALPTADGEPSITEETVPRTTGSEIQTLPTRPPGEWEDVALLPPAVTDEYRTVLDLTELFADASDSFYFKLVCACRDNEDQDRWNLLVLSDYGGGGLVFPDNAGDEAGMMISLVSATGTELKELTSTGRTTITVTASRRFYPGESPYFYDQLNYCRLESTNFRDNTGSENCFAGMIIYFDGCVMAFCDASATKEAETIRNCFDFWQSRYFVAGLEDSNK